MSFAKPKEAPRAVSKLKIKAAPGSLCAYGVVDRVIHMMGEQNRITKKRVSYVQILMTSLKFQWQASADDRSKM